MKIFHGCSECDHVLKRGEEFCPHHPDAVVESVVDSSAAARALRAIPSEERAQASRDNGKKGGRPAAPRYQVIVATIRDGNVQKITRHMISSQAGALRVAGKHGQVWMTRETADALNLDIRTFYGFFENGREFKIKTQPVLDNA